MKHSRSSYQFILAANQQQKEKKYWMEKLCEVTEKCGFEFDFKKAEGTLPIYQNVTLDIDGNLFTKLISLIKNNDLTLYIILIAGLSHILHHFSGKKNSDILIGTPIFEKEAETGLINTILVIRNIIDESKNVKEFLLQVRQTVIEAINNQNFPFPVLLDLCKQEVRESECPFFDVAFILENIQSKKFFKDTPYRVLFSFNRMENSIRFSIEYDSNLYYEDTITRIMKHYIQWLEKSTKNSSLILSEIDIIPTGLKKAIVEKFNNIKIDYPDDITLHRLFEMQVEKTPNNIAIIGPFDTASQYENENSHVCQITYNELNKKSNFLAAALIEKGIVSDSIVGIIIDPSIEMIIGLLGILKSGGAYLPIAPELPQDRIDYIIKDSGTSFIIDKKFINEVISQNLITLEQGVLIDPQALCYVIYTSGSTGKPKGVLVEHRNIVANVYSFYHQFPISSIDAVIHLSDYTFDAFAEELYPVLLRGGKMVIPYAHEHLDISLLGELINRYDISMIDCSPLLLNELNKLTFLKNIPIIISGGDVLREKYVDRLVKNGNVYNTYGPTETTVCAAYYQYIPSEENSRRPSIPIGKSIANYSVFILDEMMSIVPIGAVGEICIAGPGVTRGYLNRPDLTADKFCAFQGLVLKNPPQDPDKTSDINELLDDLIPDKLSKSFKGVQGGVVHKAPLHKNQQNNNIYYKTGDLGRWLADGNIEYTGRKDFQVKIRGFRIETGEIEVLLLNKGTLKEVVVDARTGKDGEKFLCAYYTQESESLNSVNTPQALKTFLQEKLPTYMIPAIFMKLEKLPVTASGKVNRKALPEPEIVISVEYVEPRNPIETRICLLWEKIFGRKHIGIYDNFFELGGHSLLGIQLVNDIHKEFDVKIAFAELFKHSTIQELAELILKSEKQVHHLIEAVEEREYYVSSSAQKRLYILQKMAPELTGYNMPYVFEIDPHHNKEEMEEIFRQLIARHESFRTSFDIVEDEIVQRISLDVSFSIELNEVSEAQAQEYIAAFSKPFDLGKAPLLRGEILSIGSSRRLLLLDMHHIITDGVSQYIFHSEFTALSRFETLPPLRIQYKDFSQWQQLEIVKGRLKSQELFWTQWFSGEIPVLNLPLDYPRPEVQSFEGDKIDILFGKEELTQLRNLAVTNGTTMYMLMLSLYGILLSRLGNDEEVIMGTPVAGRVHSDLDTVIGMFVNTVPIKISVKEDITLTQFLNETKDIILKSFENQEYPFEELVEKVAVNRDPARSPLFDTMFVLNTPASNTSASESSHQYSYSDATTVFGEYKSKVSKFDLTFYFNELPDDLYLMVEYCTRLFKPETIRKFIRYFRQIVFSILSGKIQNISEIEILSKDDKEEILYSFNSKESQYTSSKSTITLFEEQVERNPNHTALHLYESNHQITYRELNIQSGQIGDILQNIGIIPGDLVALNLERSLDMYIAILAIWKAGCAYVPINPKNPEERIRYLMKDSGAKLLITSLAELTEVAENKKTADKSLIGRSNSQLVQATAFQTNSLAYIIYTSGSTGNPKGVAITHDNLCPLLHWGYSQMGIGSEDRALQNLSYFFDWSVWEIFITLTSGAVLSIAPQELLLNPEDVLQYLRTYHITVLHITPTQYQGLINTPEPGNEMRLRLGTLKHLCIGAEKLSFEVVRRSYPIIREDCRIYNMYGPTEATIMAAVLDVDRNKGLLYETIGSIPIGGPIANNILYIFDKYFRLSPVRVVGELYIGGEGVALGYLNNPELTADRFNSFQGLILKNPPLDPGKPSDINEILLLQIQSQLSKSFKGVQGGVVHKALLHNDTIYYKTGDLCRWIEDGTIEYIGRIDFQVKIRGLRIELGEIENILLSHSNIKSVVVVVKGGERLCAYLVLKDGIPSENTDWKDEIREYLSHRLPDYMVPSNLIAIDGIPLNPNGKVDLKALPEPGEIDQKQKYVAPTTPVQTQLVSIWASVLGIEESSIGIDDNFFELGGHSLKGTILISRIYSVLNVKLSLAQLFTAPTIRELSREVEHVDRETYVTIPHVQDQNYFKMSSAQLRLFVLANMEPDSTQYNLPALFELGEMVDQEQIEKVFHILIQRHESFRTSFHLIDTQPVQQVHSQVIFSIDYENVEDESDLKKIIKKFVRAFDLSVPPLFRACIFHMKDKRRFLMIDMHHIISDGTSMEIFRNEFLTLYRDNLSTGALSSLTVSYKDYAHWQSGEQEQARAQRQREFWIKQFEGEIPVLNLPLDYSRPVVQSFEGRSIPFIIEADSKQKLEKIALETNSTLFMVSLGIFHILLSRLSRQDDIIIGTPVAGRRHPELANIIGMFINTLALRNSSNDSETFVRFLEKIKISTLNAFENQEYPFEDILEAVQVHRDTARNPLFDVMFALQNMESGVTGGKPGVDIKPVPFENEIAKFDMTLIAYQSDGTLHFIWEYCTRLFKEETILRFISYFKNIILTVSENPHGLLSEIEIITSEEREEVLFTFNTPSQYPNNRLAHELFMEQAEKHPDHIAIVSTVGSISQQQQITYRELDTQSYKVMLYLQKIGISSGDLVAIKMDRSADMIISILGILKTGCAYVPINSKNPEERVEFLMKDSGAKLLITSLTELMGDLEYKNPLDKNLLERLLPRKNQAEAIQDSSLAYVIYTSGSTGNPKGVPISHSNLCPLLHWGYKYVPLNEFDRSLQNLSFFFDWSVWEIFITITSGAALCIASEDVLLTPIDTIAFMDKYHITTLHITPTQYQALIGLPGEPSKDKPILGTLTYLCIGAEKLPYEIVKRSYPLVREDCRIYNMYGPTEATIMAAVLDISKDKAAFYESLGSVPIGVPIANNPLLVLDRNMKLCPVRVVGELYIGGDGIARGYLNNPELTVDRFHSFQGLVLNHAAHGSSLMLNNPDCAITLTESFKGVQGGVVHKAPLHKNQQNNTIYYKTGDLCRWLEDGSIEYIGRIDFQVKIRGYRIELGEIEDRIMKSPFVKETVVIQKTDSAGDKYLCGYVVSKGESPLDTGKLKEFISQGLPAYMVPSHIVEIEKMPLNHNGKVDLKALPEPGDIEQERKYTAPETPIEKQMVSVWASVLGIDEDRVGIDDNFFELGGHSLKGTILISRIYSVLNIKLTLAQLFTAPTVRELSRVVEKVDQEAYVAIPQVEVKNYYMMSSAQMRLYILANMEPESTQYNLPALFELGKAVDLEQVEKIFHLFIQRHESFRTSFHLIDSNPVQQIHEHVSFSISHENVEDETDLKSKIKLFIRAFDLSEPPLFRACIFHLKDSRRFLMIDMHHIISDGTSMEIFRKEFLTLYSNNLSIDSLATIKVTYKDYAQWQSGEQERERALKQREYWIKKFEGEIPVLNLPLDYPRPVVQSFEGKSVPFIIEADPAKKLNKIALDTNSTLFMVCIGIFHILLSRLSRQDDIIIGTPVAGRRHPELANIIGMFINTLALRNSSNDSESFVRFLDKIKISTLDAFENQEYPFEDILEAVKVQRDTARNPLFDVMFALQNMESGVSDEKPEVEIKPLSFESDIAKFDMTLIAFQATDETLHFIFEYCTRLFKEETIRRFIKYFKNIVTAVSENSQVLLSDIEIITMEEKEQVLYTFNMPAGKYANEKTAHGLFTDQAEKNPDQLALISTVGSIVQKQQITYRELDILSNQMMLWLQHEGIIPGDLVAIKMDRSADMIICILGILKTGCAYVPINPKNPEERVEFLMKDSGAKLLITSLTERMKGLENINTIEKNPLELLHSQHIQEEAPQNNSLAYVIYTSGSTGNPKGVPISHSNLCPLLHWGYRNVPLNEHDRTLQNLSFFFDWSVWEIFITITSGATLCITTEEVLLTPIDTISFMNKYHITTLHITPTQYQALIGVSGVSSSDKPLLGTLKYLCIGAEKLPFEIVKRSYPLVQKDCRIYNMYGPTEATIMAAVLDISKDKASYYESLGSVPIGLPIANNPLLVLDRNMKLCPVRVVGELYIGGDGIARGYLNNPELTADKFVYSAHELHELTRNTNTITNTFYKTGDLCRWLEDGSIEYIGRIDFQVKIRGYRIELGEIEDRIMKSPLIKEAVVVQKTDQAGDKYLCGYVVSKENNRLDIGKLKEFISQGLPAYMVPSHIVEIERMPLNPNGKVDLKALPEPGDIEQERQYTAPETLLEKQLVSVWASVLGIEEDRIGINDNFFELGGHSLKGTILISKIYSVLNIKMTLAQLFTAPTVRQLAAVVQGIDREIYITIPQVEEKEYYVMSPAQQRIYILAKMETGSTQYNLPALFELGESVDLEILEKIFYLFVQRHESFRTSFHLVNVNFVQRIHSNVPFVMENEKVEDLNELYLRLKKFIRHFDLAVPPLFRACIYHLKDSRRFLVIDMHHIISDGTSMEIFRNEFFTIYRDNLSTHSLPSLTTRYKDYSEWLSGHSERERIQKQKAYWIELFKGEIPLLNLPLDYQRPLVQSFEGHMLEFKIEKEETENLKKIVQQTGTTLFMVLLASFNVFLSRLSHQEDIIVGTPTAGRRHPELANIIGMFVNTLAIRNYSQDHLTFNDFLSELKTTTLDAFENQEYPFEDLVEEIGLKRDMGRNPLFDVMFVLQNMQSNFSNDFPDLGIKVFSYDSGIAKFDMTLVAIESGDALQFMWEYCTRLFKEETIQRFIGYFKNILAAISGNANILISEIEFITIEEKEQILYTFNIPDRYPNDRLIHELFIEQAGKYPDSIALLSTGDSNLQQQHITYNELDIRSDLLALQLQHIGIISGNLVAIKMDRSVEMILTILAVLKLGCAYVPINPKNPEERVEYLMKDSGAKLLITSLSELMEDPENNKTLNKNLIERKHSQQVQGGVIKNNSLAYVIYTSGSTGNPKGVPISHSNLCPLLYWGYQYVPLNEYDRTLQNLSFFFDWSVWEIFITLTRGAMLCIASDEVLLTPSETISFIEKYDITTLHITPTQYQALIGTSGEPINNKPLLGTLKYLGLGAEKLPYELVKRSYQLIREECRIYNMYGPTEATILAAVLDISKDKAVFYESLGSIPIGVPIANNSLLVLDRNMKLCPVRVVGELYIGGNGIACGYLNKPELTAERFVFSTYELHQSTPTTNTITNTFYKTGDVCRWLEDGTIEYIGRIDFQVKIRGYRIELGEIENRIMKSPYVIDAIVVQKTDHMGEKYLCGYVVSKGDNPVDLGKLKEYISQGLPAYMVPSQFVEIKRMPLNPNGKVDLKALPEPVDIKEERKYTAPETLLEKQLVSIWSSILGIEEDHIGIDDNFFELGGHSLRGMVLISRIQKNFNIRISLPELFKNSTIRMMIEYFESALPSDSYSIENAEEKEYYPLSSMQKRLYLVNKVEPDSTGYNIPAFYKINGNLDKKRFTKVIDTMIMRHQSFRTSFHLMGETLVQRIHPVIQFSVETFSTFMEEKNETPELIFNRFVRPFDLSVAPLIRVGLIEDDNRVTMIMIDMHHIISDGVSLEIFYRELLALYRDYPQTDSISPVAYQYTDYSNWQSGYRGILREQQQRTFWLNQFEGEIPVLDLPLDYQRPSMQSFEGRTIPFIIEKAQFDTLSKIALENNATLFMVCLEILHILLSRLSRQDDIIVGTPVAGRRHPELANVIGMFVNTLALRNTSNDSMTYTRFLDIVKHSTLEAFENQEYPFEEILEGLQIKRDTARNPLFDIMFALQNMESTVIDKNLDIQLQSIDYESKIAKFDLTLVAFQSEEELHFSFQYCTRLFKEQTILRLIRYFKNIVIAVSGNPQIPISEIDMITPEEREQIIFEFNQQRDTPRTWNKTVPQLFDEQVERTPDHIALSELPVQLTFRQLDHESRRFSHYLKKQGIVPRDLVAISINRSIEMIVGVLGILKAGCTYVPINPKNPENRIKYLLEDSGARVLVNTEFFEESKKHRNEIETIEEDVGYASVEDYAYILYTSGSTGNPKGVPISHANLTPLYYWGYSNLHFQTSDRTVQTPSFFFDWSVWEIFMTLISGASLFMINDEILLNPSNMVDFIHKQDITILHVTPTQCRYIVDIGKPLTPLKYLLMGGEKLTLVLVQELFKLLSPKCRVFNQYGATEAAIISTAVELNPVDVVKYNSLTGIPIGYTINGTSLYIYDKSMNLCPVNIPGELYIGGEGLSNGYLNNPELAADRFIKCFGKVREVLSQRGKLPKADMLYKTGDLAKWLDDGQIEFLGRIDFQVKIRGYRIEIGEIENYLLSYSNIKDAVVVALSDEASTEKFLCAYIVAYEGEISIQDLREYLGKNIPQYMIPQAFVQLENIPLNPNGKADLKRLPKPQLKAKEGFIPPADETETQMVEIWASVLGTDKESISMDDNFFLLGGHSLKATILLTKIHQVFDIEISLAEIFKNPTPRELCAYISLTKWDFKPGESEETEFEEILL